LPLLEECHFAIASFDFWMPNKPHYVFVLVINFWDLIGRQTMLLLVYLSLLKAHDKHW